MSVIAPWLHPLNFIDAARAGASLGLQAREQDIQQSQSADRLQLAYDTLASQEKRASQQALARQQLAQASLALRGQQMDMLNQYRQSMLGQREQGLGLQAQREADLQEGRKARAEDRESILGLRERMLDFQKQREENIGGRFKSRQDASAINKHIQRLSTEIGVLNHSINNSIDESEKSRWRAQIAKNKDEIKQYEDQLFSDEAPGQPAAKVDPKDPLGLFKK